ncbi:MAG: NADH-quinone oxidoreductase subunit L [Planctomycetes bacterium]|nr:NADH-quinone oxidoreductase subunit L [Planctomycetota bacterium]
MPISTDEIGLCQIALVILVLPLAGFVVQAFFGSRLPRQGDWLPTACILGSLILACYMVLQLLGSPEGIAVQKWYPALGQNWINVGGEDGSGGAFTLHFGVMVDNLTIIMLFVVTLVSFLVHLYSWGYMHGEVRYNYFFAYLGLFTFSMLGLCIASSLLFLFIFWELVGVCSYFLIGFYFEKKSAQQASIKAFMTTRLGDVGMFIAILVIAAQVGSLEFDSIFASLQSAGIWTPALLTFAGICLFFGPIGKSAQFPLHVWLPDAMEGPTPVSALIHAATMVAAGVYLVGRMFPFLAGEGYYAGGNFFDSDALFFVALVGAFTAFMAATIAFSQSDIKKVLAYSTISQLGYMMLGLGVGSVTAGLFHLTTHAFFKALLFLCSGSVIHAVHSNEMDDMGGLRKKLPITYITCLIGTLAIAGMPLLSGFYSKDAILAQASAFGHHRGTFLAYLPYILGVVTAFMTCFYMFRMFFKTFHGEPRNQEAYSHAHESPWTMTVPLCILAVLSVVSGGLLGTESSHWFESRISSKVLAPFGEPGEILTKVTEQVHHVHGLVMGVAITLFVIGVVAAGAFFLPKGPFFGRNLVSTGPLAAVNSFLKNLWYIDRFYSWIVLRVLHLLHSACGAFDKYVVDGFVNFWGSLCQYVTSVVGSVDFDGVDGTVRALGETTLWGGGKGSRMQTGLLQQYVYASVFLFAGIFLVAVLFYLFAHPGVS